MYVIEPILQDRKTEAPERLSNFCKATQLVGGLGSNVGLSGVKACNFNIFALGGKKSWVHGKGWDECCLEREGDPEREENDDGRLCKGEDLSLEPCGPPASWFFWPHNFSLPFCVYEQSYCSGGLDHMVGFKNWLNCGSVQDSCPRTLFWGRE